MRQLLIIVLFFSLCGCSALDKPSKSEAVETVRMVCVDGTLYSDTGEESEATARCGVMDGTIESSVAAQAIPEKDNQSNFGTGYDYQFGAEGTVEIAIDGKFIIFASSEMADWGVQLSVKNVNANGAMLVFTQKGGNPSGELLYGEEFSLFKNEKGAWQELKPVTQNYGFHMVAYGIEPDTVTQKEVAWDWLYGSLQKGEYKIVKSVMDFRGTGDYDTKAFEAEFMIP